MSALAAMLLFAGLSVVPLAVPATAAEQVDQGTDRPTCDAINYTASVSPLGGATVKAWQSFTPNTNQLTAVELCVNVLPTADLAEKIKGTIAVGAPPNATALAGAALEVEVPRTGFQWVTARLTKPFLLTRPGGPTRSEAGKYLIEVTLPAGVEWRGTCQVGVGSVCPVPAEDSYGGGEAYPPDASVATLINQVGDFGFKTYADPVPKLFLRQSDFHGAVAQRTEESFDGFADGDPLEAAVSGVALRSEAGPLVARRHDAENPDAGNFAADPTPLLGVSVLRGEFDRPTSGVGFNVVGHAPSGRASVRIERADGTSVTYTLAGDDGDEATPYFFGYETVGDQIAAFELRSPANDAIGLDDLEFGRHIPRAIVHTRGAAPARDIWIVRPDGSSALEVRATAADESDPDWAPDGSAIAFVSNEGGASDIWVMDADGTDARNLTGTFAGAATSPAWSPDGGRIVFAANDDLWLVNTTTHAITPLTGTADLDASPAWSPAGDRLAFIRNGQLSVVHADGSNATPVGSLPGDERDPAWSMAGIVYATNAGGDLDLHRVSPDGTGAAVVLDTPLDEVSPTWGPDEDAVVFSQSGRLVHLVLASAATSSVTAGPADATPSWFPGGEAGADDLSLTADRASARVAAEAVDLRSIPSELLPLIVSGAQASPVGSIPAGSIPAGSIPAGSIPAGSIDLAASPAGSIPVGALPAGSIPAGSIGLTSVLLSSLPIDLAALLAGSAFEGLPPQTITLAQALDDPVVGPRLRAMTIAESGLGATLFGDLSIVALLLGGLPLAQLPLPLGVDAASWCELFARFAFSCAAAGIDPSRHSLAGAQLAAAPVKSVPAGSIPLEALPLDSIPAGSIPAGSIDLASSPAGSIQIGTLATEDSAIGSIPAGSIPAGSIPAGSIPVGAVLLRSIDLAASPAGSITVGTIPAGSIGNVIDCEKTTCPVPSGTPLRDVAHAIKPTATLSDLGAAALAQILLWHIGGAALDAAGVTLASLTGALDGVTLADLQGALGSITIYSIVLDLLLRTNFPWERLPIDGMQDFAGLAGNEIGYTARAAITCASPQSASMTVTLPKGFRYVPGSGRQAVGGAPAASAAPVIGADNSLRWAVPQACSAAGAVPVTITFQARPGFRTGEFDADLSVAAGPTTTTLADQARVLIVENGEPDSPSSPRPAALDTLVIGHISSPTDVDTYSIPMPPAGHRVHAFLSHIDENADFDLVIGAPTSPFLQSAPAGSIPAGSIPMEDRGIGLDGAGTNLPPETLQDIPAGSIPAGSISATRGNDDERAQVIAAGSNPLVVQVSGYNGSHSPQAYVLRLQSFAPAKLPPCATRSGINPSDDPAVSLPKPSSATKTVLLVNRGRMADLYGAANTTAMMDKLSAFASRSEVGGQVVPVDGDAAVRSAYAAWDASPCSVDAANNVVRAINDVVLKYRAASPNVRYVVLIGSDEAMPFSRVPDLTTLSNEQDIVSDLAFTLGPDRKANALYAAAALGFVLADDAYVAFTRYEWLGRELFLPQIGVGRLVESSLDVIGQIDQYIANNGIVDPTTGTALITGYDFLTDGSKGVADEIAKAAPQTKTLITDTWAKTDLVNVYTGATPVPTIASVNAHYSHWQAQPAGPVDPNARFTRSDLFTTEDVQPSILPGTLLFTMGCHGGLNVPDSSVRGGLTPAAQDWAQEHAQQRAAVYLANTGYGYGDTVTVDLSERLMVLFARELSDKSTTIGEKYVRAKHAYYTSMGTYGAFDEKVLVQATLYGLPHWRVGPAGAGPQEPAPPPVVVDETTGDATWSFSFNPTTTARSDGQKQWWQGKHGVSYAHYRPLQPLEVVNATVPGRTAKGVYLTGLRTEDLSVTGVKNARPTIDLSGNEPEVSSKGTIYPANLARIATSRRFGDLRQNLILILGQTREEEGQTVQRLVRTVSGEVGYSASGDNLPPTIRRVVAVRDQETGHLRISVTGSDQAGGTGIKKASALILHSSFNGQWRFVELGLEPSTGVWTALTDVPSGTVQIAAQMMDNARNVAYSSNKGQLFSTVFGDVQPPTVKIDRPGDGQEFVLGQVAIASYGCEDTLGVIRCEGSVPNGAPLDTSTPGTKSFMVTATDAAGNTTTVERKYIVSGSYTFVGFKSPLRNPPTINVVNAGSTTPVKWELKGPDGHNVRDPAAIVSIERLPLSCTPGATRGYPTSTGTTSTGLEYDMAGDQFVYHHTVPSSTRGCEALRITFRDTTYREAWFEYR